MGFLGSFNVFPIRPEMTAAEEAMLDLTNIGNASKALRGQSQCGHEKWREGQLPFPYHLALWSFDTATKATSGKGLLCIRGAWGPNINRPHLAAPTVMRPVIGWRLMIQRAAVHCSLEILPCPGELSMVVERYPHHFLG